MINFFWQLFCAMDLDLSNKKRAMEEGPDEEFNALEYENLCTLHITLDEQWGYMEDDYYDNWKSTMDKLRNEGVKAGKLQIVMAGNGVGKSLLDI